MGRIVFQDLAPIDFGIISLKKRIIKVSTAEKSERYSLPHVFWASAPAPAAPIVCAMVFKVRIEARGFSISA
ncbi:MAG: hypothetical protein ACJAS4_003356 [Bacteriovoracaceae bacterium]|jgi:hypothetical protein